MCLLLCFAFVMTVSAKGADSFTPDGGEETCMSFGQTSPLGDSFIQARKARNLVQVKRPPLTEMQVLEETNVCKPVLPAGLKHERLEWHLTQERQQTLRIAELQEDPVDGENAPLNATGFKAVTACCCPVQMEAFFNRLLGSLGYKGCSKSHIQGLMHWFTCVPEMDFQYVVSVITNGNPCKYWAKVDECCPPLSPACEGNQCATQTTPRSTTDTVCCKDPSPWVAPSPVPPSTFTAIGQFDCQGSPEPIQLLVEGSSGWRTAGLDPFTGVYSTVVVYPWNVVTPSFSALNAAGINPIDQIAYGLLTVAGTKHIVRMDQQQMEFIAKNVGCSVSGVVSARGTFYCSTAKSLVMVPEIHKLKGYSSPNDPLQQDLRGIKWNLPDRTNALGNDFVTVDGDLDSSGDDADYIVSVTKVPGPKITVVKAVGNSFKQVWTLPVPDAIEGEDGQGFGAAWNYQNRLYFGHNGGFGVYEVLPENINLSTLAPVPLRLVGKSAATNRNDGMNCNGPDPWRPQGICPDGFFQPLMCECPPGAVQA